MLVGKVLVGLVVILVTGRAVVGVDSQTEPECWHPYPSGMATAMARGCAAQMAEHVYIAGGVDDTEPISKLWSLIDLQSDTEWLAFQDFLPFRVSGPATCAVDGPDTLYLSQASSTASPTVGDYFFRLTLNNGVSNWVPRLSSLRRRRKGGFVIHQGLGYIFGGLDDTNSFVEEVEQYNTTTDTWAYISSMSGVNSDLRVDGVGFCDCVPLPRGKHIYLVCIPCYTNAPNFNVTILKFDPLALPTPTFEFLYAITVGPAAAYLSMEAVAVAQFLVITVVSTTAQVNGPTVYFYDIVMKQCSSVITGSFGTNRFGGSLFVSKSYLFYSGGREYTLDSSPIPVATPGNFSTAVSELRALVGAGASVNYHNHTYYIFDHILVQTSATFDCSGALNFRLASSIDCQTPVSSLIADSRCFDDGGSSGVAIFIAAATVEKAYLCASLGTCAGPQTACPAGAFQNFADCNYNGCCWDESTQNCFAYNSGGVSEENMFYFNVDLTPISITYPPQAPSPDPSFFQTKAGVVTICVCAAIIVVMAVAVIAYFQKRAPELEHPLENNSKYRLVSKLGQGGFGTVFLVQRKGAKTIEQFAMKYIACQSEEDRHYAMKEFELIRNAQGHPNMVRLVDMFMSWSNETSINEAPSSPKDSKTSNEKTALLSLAPRYVCIVMDYFPEGDLANYILDNWRQGAPEAFVLNVICKQVCTLLQHLHALTPPIVHRDLKPENLLLADHAKKVVVTDFGLAQQVEKSYMTTRAGSLHYVAPECWKRHYTAAVDMWGLGCILYASCTGRVTADTARVMFSDARDRGFERDIRYDLRKFSVLLVDIIVGLLQVDPNKRLTSSQVLEMIEKSGTTS